MTTRFQRCIATTRPAPIWPDRPARCNRSTRSDQETTMETVMDNRIAQPKAFENAAPAKEHVGGSAQSSSTAPAAKRSRSLAFAGVGALLLAAVAVSAFSYY